MYFTNQKFYEAEETYTEALDNELSDNMFVFELHYSRAKVRTKIGYYSEAIVDCTQSLRIKPLHVNLLLLRAVCHQYLDKFQQSIDDYESALQLNEIHEETAAHIQSTIRSLKLALNQHNADVKKKYGNEYYAKKMYTTASIYYSEAIALWPENVTYYWNRSACYMMMSNFKEAIADCSHAVTVDVNFSKGYIRMIKCQLILGDTSGAERAISNWQKFDSNNDSLTEYKKELNNLMIYETEFKDKYRRKSFKLARECIVLFHFIHLH